MATAFELLQEYSTAPIGSTAWEHLNSQEGGGSGPTFLTLSDGLDLEVTMTEFTVEVEDGFDVLVEDIPEYTVELEPIEYIVEVDNE